MDQKLSANLICKLDQDVINKISAGEVIHRPFNVVKELIENSLDAGSTMIDVTLKMGGLKKIIIKDNGCGINKEDLKLICDRFTTSKLKSFDDFNSLNTFGFRGEALSSISTVSRVTIISKTAASYCAYKAEYVDGHLKDNSIISMADSNGTTIVVDDLFYNMPLRKTALSSPVHELNLVQELILKYSLIFSGKCGFILKKHEENSHLINTKVSDSLFNNINRLFSQDISSYLIPINLENENLNYNVSGYFSNNDLNMKKMNFILSINSRLVECASLKKSLTELYRSFLMKGGHPFLIIFIKIHPKNIDVNIHPNKNEVSFLYDNEIISSISDFIQNRLNNVPAKDLVLNSSLHDLSFEINNSIMNSTQKPDISILDEKPSTSSILNQTPIKSTMLDSSTKQCRFDKKSIEKTTNKKISSSKLVRVDPKLQRIDQYLNQRPCSNTKKRTFELTSLLDLRKEVLEKTDDNFLNRISKSNFVGCVDETYFLIQHELDLILLRMESFNQELFYQLILFDFGNFNYIRFVQPLPIRRLLSTYLEVNQSNDAESHPEQIESLTNLLISKRELLDDYFSIRLNDQHKTIEAIPILIENHKPNYGYLPEFLFHLASKVNWTKEKECFHGIGQEISRFYSHPPNIPDSEEFQSWSKFVKDDLYEFYKKLLLPSKNVQDSFIVITDVEKLYKTFERC